MTVIRPTIDDLATTDFQQGALLLVDKPRDWTSFDVVNKLRATLRHLLNVRKLKVGHSGTLDPAATGLLVICTGKWTKRLFELQGLDKTYQMVMQLGGVTASYDGETEVTDEKPFDHITKQEILSVMDTFRGEIKQIPPMYSAIKVKGTPLYRLARRGDTLELEPRPVVIHSLEIEEIDLPTIKLNVQCSKGTYVRSLAHDIGQALGCGAYLSALQRTEVGPYHLDQAWALEPLIERLQELQRVE